LHTGALVGPALQDSWGMARKTLALAAVKKRIISSLVSTGKENWAWRTHIAAIFRRERILGRGILVAAYSPFRRNL